MRMRTPGIEKLCAYVLQEERCCAHSHSRNREAVRMRTAGREMMCACAQQEYKMERICVHARKGNGAVLLAWTLQGREVVDMRTAGIEKLFPCAL